MYDTFYVANNCNFTIAACNIHLFNSAALLDTRHRLVLFQVINLLTINAQLKNEIKKYHATIR